MQAMHLPRALVLLLVLLSIPGCRSGKNGTAEAGLPALVAAAVLGGGRVLLDPLATRVLLGTILLQNALAVGTLNGNIRFLLAAQAGYEADEAEVVLGPGEQRTVAVYTTLLLATALTFPVFARYERGGDPREFPILWNNEAAASLAFLMCQQLGGGQLAVLWYASALLAQVGVLTSNSNRLVPQSLPLLLTEIRMFGALLAFFTLLELEDTFANTRGAVSFPDGQGPNGFTIPATPLAPLAAGEYAAFWLSTQAPIPLADPSKLYQYAFVMDSDTNPANNYVPSPAFADDFFGGTDRWYELSYSPANGWVLRCKVVGPGNTITTVASGARAILNGDTFVLFVPRSEFVVAHPPFRATTFCHNGDFGQNPPYEWSGDPTPTVAEGLRSWQ